MATSETTQIIWELVYKAEEAIKKQAQFEAKVKSSEAAVDSLGRKVSGTMSGKLGFTETTKEAEQFRVKIVKTFKDAGQAKDGFKTNLGGLGSVAKYVFGTILGLGAAQVIQRLIQYLIQATTEALAFSKAIFSLQIGINALRRSGVDITMQDMLGNIRALRQEFKVFSERDLVAGSAQLVNLSRDFGFTKEQIFQLQRTIATLAIVNGKSMEEVQRTVALALSSGYTEGLQRLGVSMNRVTIAAKAQEMGFADNYNALTEQERALASLAQIEDKTAKYADDLVQYYETMPGAIEAATSAFEDMKVAIGEFFLPIWAELMVFIGGAANFFKRFFGEALPRMLSNAVFMYALLGHTAKEAFGAMAGKGFNFQNILDAATKAREEVRRTFSGELPGFEAPIIPPEGEGPSEEETKIMQDATEDMVDLRREYEEKMIDMNEKFWSDMDKIDEDHFAKNAELWKEWEDEVVKINEDAKRKIEDAERELGYDIEDLNRDTANKIEDANRKYREQELKEERDYQEKLRKLREEFLFDLEDALHERDARQILRLIRRYKLDLEQLQRQNNEEQQERQEAYRNEIEDIQRQRERKLQELQIEHQRRLEEIERQRVLEQEAATKKRDEEILAEREAWIQKSDERKAQRDKDKAALDEWLQEQLTSLVTKYIEMENASDDMAAKMTQIFASVFGKGGTIEGQLSYFRGLMAQAVADAQARQQEIQAIMSNISALSVATPTAQTYAPLSGGGTAIANPNPLAHASGASFVTTRPKMFMAGEVPELITVTPLNQLGNGGAGNGVGGSAAIAISLSSGLQAEIVDNALEQVAIALDGGIGR